jgi:uncharacterized membrane protein YbhN (UPF0104 family)
VSSVVPTDIAPTNPPGTTPALVAGDADPDLPASATPATVGSRASHPAAVWLRRAAGLLITALIFVWMFKPLLSNWAGVRDCIRQIDWRQALLASAMFAVFLFVFRVLSWRHILKGLGAPLPLAPATRIWSASELARYLPGVIWQVVGRVYLVRPYGISGSICSASQILELILFLLANVLMAVGCLTWFGVKQMHDTARWRLIGVAAVAPVLLILLHPRIFYSLLNSVLAKIGKPPISQRLPKRQLSALLGWAMLGLLWQSLAIWLVTHTALHLPLPKWWVVAGAYCLAWCAGFLAFWAPGGLGVRELVFMAALSAGLPPAVRAHFTDPRVLPGFIAFLSVLLRLWATTGELMLAAAAAVADPRGWLGPRAAK